MAYDRRVKGLKRCVLKRKEGVQPPETKVKGLGRIRKRRAKSKWELTENVRKRIDTGVVDSTYSCAWHAYDGLVCPNAVVMVAIICSHLSIFQMARQQRTSAAM